MTEPLAQAIDAWPAPRRQAEANQTKDPGVCLAVDASRAMRPGDCRQMRDRAKVVA
jgi:hypothetical protein